MTILGLKPHELPTSVAGAEELTYHISSNVSTLRCSCQFRIPRTETRTDTTRVPL
jgi:hypothetical protein